MKEFKLFGIPPEADEFLTIGFLIIFLLSVTINYNVCGGGATAVFKEKYNLEPTKEKDDLFKSSNSQYETILKAESQDYYFFKENFIYFVQQQTNMYFKQSQKGFWFGMFLYWIAVPFLCYYYAIFKFKKGMWERARKAEDLYNSVYKEQVTG